MFCFNLLKLLAQVSVEEDEPEAGREEEVVEGHEHQGAGQVGH